VAEASANCGEALKIGMISSNQAFTGSMVRVINLASEPQLSAACDRCGDKLLAEAKTKLNAESSRLKKLVQTVLPKIPIASIHSPFAWEYDVIDVLTAQSVTGTGIFSDVASAFTDLFGTQSGTYNAKLREGENLCKMSLRAQAIEAGGNAILAADIDYAEVGGQRAMLMVCMTGTVVRLTNPERISADFEDLIRGATEDAARIRQIESALASLNAYN
jgi:uncharacterized protein YbjQ (UPF0145 family)